MTSPAPSGIPKIIHQTWKTRQIPDGMGYPESWQKLNPQWTYRFWTDDDLLKFFRQERPDLLELYLSYPRPVQKADLARYCILQKFGGVYADIDTECLAPLDPLAGDARVILCAEPVQHQDPAQVRGLDRLWFNGTMASPPDHPFWDEVIGLCRLMAPRRGGDVLETTGPLILSAAVQSWPKSGELALNSANLFSGADIHGNVAKDDAFGPYGHLTLSTHLWKGSWYVKRHSNLWQRKLARLRQARDWLLGGPRLNPDDVLGALDRELLARSVPPADADAHVLVLIPVQNAADHLPRCFDRLLALIHRRDRLHLRFGHGYSQDGSGELLARFVETYGGHFGSAAVIDIHQNAPQLARATRWKPKYQRARRSGIAKARNALLRQSLRAEHAWVLWIDADVVDYPQDILSTLMAQGEKIVVPHCVLEPGGPSFDLNSFLTITEPNRVAFFRHVRDGLLQPPADWFARRHLHDLRYLPRVPLHGVGGTMLLVAADCHRAGLIFPDLPYRHLIETEGFGAMARDAGIVPIGLPQLEIIHAKA